MANGSKIGSYTPYVVLMLTVIISLFTNIYAGDKKAVEKNTTAIACTTAAVADVKEIALENKSDIKVVVNEQENIKDSVNRLEKGQEKIINLLLKIERER